MPINWVTVVKTASMTAKRDTVANGTLEIRNSADAVLVTYGLSASAGSVTGDTWTLALDSATVAASAAGTAAKAVLKNSAGTVRGDGLTVGTAGANIILNNTSIALAQNVTITSATVQHAA